MRHDFDRVVDRIHTNDMRWHSGAVSAYLGREIPEDMVPMWLADTEFACMPGIVEAVKVRAEKEIFGYCFPGPDFYKAVCWWQKERFGWMVDPSWVVSIPTVVAGINVAIRAFSGEGDGVIIQQPVYDVDYAREHIPGAQIVRPEGTFLCWLDLSALGCDDGELFERVLLNAAVICVPGPWFGPGGEGDLRLNIGCPRTLLKTALVRIAVALK